MSVAIFIFVAPCRVHIFPERDWHVLHGKSIRDPGEACVPMTPGCGKCQARLLTRNNCCTRVACTRHPGTNEATGLCGTYAVTTANQMLTLSTCTGSVPNNLPETICCHRRSTTSTTQYASAESIAKHVHERIECSNQDDEPVTGPSVVCP